MRRLAIGLALVAWLCTGGAASSAAAPITFEFTGTVTQTMFDPDDPFSGAVGFGTAFSGSYTFDSAIVDDISIADWGSYTSPSGLPYHFTVIFGGYTFSSSDFLNIGVSNDLGGKMDFYSVLGCSGGASCPGSSLTLSLYDVNRAVFTNDALPLNAPPFSAFEIATFEFRGLIGGNQVEVFGNLDSLTTCAAGCEPVNEPAPIPEPGTLLLLGSALTILSRRLRSHHS